MIDLVGKIGSMALIDQQRNDIDYQRIYRLSTELKPGIIWVSSGATEIGRLDYIKRSGHELSGNQDEVKTDYASQGQAMLMQCYRASIDPSYSVRQVLVEHQHFNNPQKREHLKNLLLRAVEQNAIPIINYNDAVSFEENRKNEIKLLKNMQGKAIELVDNDETASQIACLVQAKTLLILSSVNGIYQNPEDESSIIAKISGKTEKQLTEAINSAMNGCVGASRAGAGGARAKLEYVKDAALNGTRVIIANAKYSISQIMQGDVPFTEIYLG